MSLLKFKNIVIVPKSCIIAAALINSANSLGLINDMLVTSGNDSKHKNDSKHYTNEALDFRTKHLSKPDRDALIKTVKRRLGRNYDVILEFESQVNEHLHIEWDEK